MVGWIEEVVRENPLFSFRTRAEVSDSVTLYNPSPKKDKIEDSIVSLARTPWIMKEKVINNKIILINFW